MALRSLTVGALLAFSSLMGTTMAATEKTPQDPVLGTDTVHGCYSSLGELVLNNSHIDFNSQGACTTACKGIGKAVGATYSYACYCGDKYPPKASLTDDSKCNEVCPGYAPEACGGIDVYTVYNTGVKVAVADSDGSSASSSSAGSKPTSTAAIVTDTVTPTSSPSNSGQSSGGSNTVGIAVGVVVGVLAAASLVGGVFFYMRRKRNQEIEEEHRRNAAVNAFVNGGKPPSSSGGISVSDSRLDPVMAQRRMSDGSIADNEDYSRRILRVTNA